MYQKWCWSLLEKNSSPVSIFFRRWVVNLTYCLLRLSMLNFENCCHVNIFRVRSRINTGQFPKRVPKVLVSGGSSGGACFPGIFFLFQLPKVPSPGFLSHLDRILASSIFPRWSLANWQIISSPSISIFQWIWSKASLNHFPDFSLEVFFLIVIKNILVMKNLTNFHKTEETGVDPRLTLLENPRSWLGLV